MYIFKKKYETSLSKSILAQVKKYEALSENQTH